jgi:hypothetical protein
VEGLLAAIEATAVAQHLRMARWEYAAVNATHILGVALLVGGILPLDLRLLGAWDGVQHTVLARVLVPMAAAGLALAIVTGLLLFSIRAREYAVLGVFQIKLALVAVGASAALVGHWAHGRRLEHASHRQMAAHGAISMTCWLGALVCGRLIAFAGD